MRIVTAASVLIVSLTVAMPAWATDDTPAKSRNATIMLDGQCGTINLTYNRQQKLYGTLHTICAVPGEQIAGIGAVVMHRPPGGSVAFNESVTDGDGTTVSLYLIKYPFVSGHLWFMYQTKNGADVALRASGLYTVISQP